MKIQHCSILLLLCLFVGKYPFYIYIYIYIYMDLLVFLFYKGKELLNLGKSDSERKPHVNNIILLLGLMYIGLRTLCVGKHSKQLWSESKRFCTTDFSSNSLC